MHAKYPILITERGGLGITAALVVNSAPKRFLPSVPFIIDTGADITQINEVETVKLGLVITSLPRSIKPVISCGGRVQAHIIEKPIILLQDNDKQHKEFMCLDQIHATEQPSEKGQKGERLKKMLLPNLLGRDFLKASKLKLFVDLHESLAYLEE